MTTSKRHTASSPPQAALAGRGVGFKDRRSLCHINGAVLVTGLLVLAVMTILGLGSMRGTILQERMAGNLKEQASAFQAAEAALQAALTAIERSPSPPARDVWGSGSLAEACKVTDPDGADACTRLESLLVDWRTSPTPALGVPLASLGGSPLLEVQETRQPRLTVEERYVPPLEFESAAQGRGLYFYTVTALGTGQVGHSKTILQTTIPKVFAW